MRLEFHQLDRRWEHLRVRHPARHHRLLASLAAAGQQTPIVVVPLDGQPDHYLVIDGYQRIAALQQLGRDTVAAVLWPMSEAEALLLDGTRRWSEQPSALEQGWLLAALQQRFGYGLDELARRFDRSVSWVSRRLALVELLPEAMQQQVREGSIAAQVAMKYLVPAARISLDDCQRLAAIFAQHHSDTRQAGLLYTAWRDSSPLVRQRILAAPELFFKMQRAADDTVEPRAAKTQRDLELVAAMVRRIRRQWSATQPPIIAAQRQELLDQITAIGCELGRLAEQLGKEDADTSATHDDSGTARPGSGQARDCARAGSLAPERAQRSALERSPGSGDATPRESRTIPAAHFGSFQRMQGESRASP